MAELINLRLARKKAQRRDATAEAAANRLAHGQPKQQRELRAALQRKTDRNLDAQRIDKGDR